MTKSKPAMFLLAVLLVFTMFAGTKMEVSAAETNCVGNKHHLLASCGGLNGITYFRCEYRSCGHSGGSHPDSCLLEYHMAGNESHYTFIKCAYCTGYLAIGSSHSAASGHTSRCSRSNSHSY